MKQCITRKLDEYRQDSLEFLADMARDLGCGWPPEDITPAGAIYPSAGFGWRWVLPLEECDPGRRPPVVVSRDEQEEDDDGWEVVGSRPLSEYM